MTTNKESLAALLAAETEASEVIYAEEVEAERRGEELPAYPTENRTRPNRGEVFSVRLRPAELAELKAAAAMKGLPPATVARSMILSGLSRERHGAHEASVMSTLLGQWVSERLGDEESQREPVTRGDLLLLVAGIQQELGGEPIATFSAA